MNECTVINIFARRFNDDLFFFHNLCQFDLIKFLSAKLVTNLFFFVAKLGEYEISGSNWVCCLNECQLRSG